MPSTNRVFVDNIGEPLGDGDNIAGRFKITDGTDVVNVTGTSLDVIQPPSSTLDHGANRDVDASIEALTATSYACKFGVTVIADPANSGTVYVGNSDVTAGTTDATDGVPLRAGVSMFLPISNPNLLYVIGSAANQVVYWVAV